MNIIDNIRMFRAILDFPETPKYDTLYDGDGYFLSADGFSLTASAEDTDGVGYNTYRLSIENPGKKFKGFPEKLNAQGVVAWAAYAIMSKHEYAAIKRDTAKIWPYIFREPALTPKKLNLLVKTVQERKEPVEPTEYSGYELTVDGYSIRANKYSCFAQRKLGPIYCLEVSDKHGKMIFDISGPDAEKIHQVFQKKVSQKSPITFSNTFGKSLQTLFMSQKVCQKEQ
jgi:hypothetical protein